VELAVTRGSRAHPPTSTPRTANAESTAPFRCRICSAPPYTLLDDARPRDELRPSGPRRRIPAFRHVRGCRSARMLHRSDDRNAARPGETTSTPPSPIARSLRRPHRPHELDIGRHVSPIARAQVVRAAPRRDRRRAADERVRAMKPAPPVTSALTRGSATGGSKTPLRAVLLLRCGFEPTQRLRLGTRTWLKQILAPWVSEHDLRLPRPRGS